MCVVQKKFCIGIIQAKMHCSFLNRCWLSYDPSHHRASECRNMAHVPVNICKKDLLPQLPEQEASIPTNIKAEIHPMAKSLPELTRHNHVCACKSSWRELLARWHSQHCQTAKTKLSIGQGVPPIQLGPMQMKKPTCAWFLLLQILLQL